MFLHTSAYECDANSRGTNQANCLPRHRPLRHRMPTSSPERPETERISWLQTQRFFVKNQSLDAIDTYMNDNI